MLHELFSRQNVYCTLSVARLLNRIRFWLRGWRLGVLFWCCHSFSILCLPFFSVKPIAFGKYTVPTGKKRPQPNKPHRCKNLATASVRVRTCNFS